MCASVRVGCCSPHLPAFSLGFDIEIEMRFRCFYQQVCCSQPSCEPIADGITVSRHHNTLSLVPLPHRLVVAMILGQPGTPPNLGTGTAQMPGAPGQMGLVPRETALTTGMLPSATHKPTKDQVRGLLLE